MSDGKHANVGSLSDGQVRISTATNSVCLQHGVFSLVLVGITLIPYWQTKDFGFVNFDDPFYVVNNPLLSGGLTFERMRDAIFGFHESNWHPLVWLSYMVEVQLCGMNPQVMHITNVLLHILNSLLVYWWLCSSTGDRVRGILAALWFAIHPMHVESVAWITERKDVLSTFFLLLTLIAYSAYVRNGLRRYYFLSIVLFSIGLTAKAMLVTVPAILLLLDYWPHGRCDSGQKLLNRRLAWRQMLFEKVPFVVLSAAVSVVTILAQQRSGAVAGMGVLSFKDRFANAFVSFSRYVLKCFWPVNLSVYYPMPPSGWSVVAVAISVLIFLSITILATVKRREHPAALTGWCWFVITLLPVIGIVQVGYQSMADRYSYVPMIGLSIMLLWGLPDRCFKRQAVSFAVVVFSGSALVLLAKNQASYWRNSVALFEHALALEPENNRVSHQNLGNAYFESGRLEEARIHFEAAVKLDPKDPDKVEILARSLLQEGKTEEAEDLLVRAIQLNAQKASLWLLLGNALKSRGETEKAIGAYSKAVEVDSSSSEALNNLGLMICRSNNAEGMKFIRRAIESNPENAQAHNSLGNALVREGLLAEAETSYLEAIRLADLPESKQNLEYVRELKVQQGSPK